jgi:hypothetical protein
MIPSPKRQDSPIRRCEASDFDQIWSIINDGASAYRGVIPADCWTEPYMPTNETP